VGVLFRFDTVQQILLIYGLYVVLINGAIERAAFAAKGPIMLVAQGFFGAAAIAMVRIFFGLRVWTVANTMKKPLRHMLLGTIVALSICYFAAACLYLEDILDRLATNNENQGQGVLGRDRLEASIFAIAGDVIICISLIWILKQHRTGMGSLDAILRTIILFAIHTGLLFTILNLCSLITTYELPNTLIYVVFGYTASKVYINSALASLNYRDTMNDRVVKGSQDCSKCGSIGMEFVRASRRKGGVTSSTSISFDSDDPSLEPERPKSLYTKTAGSIPLEPIREDHEDKENPTFTITRMTV